MADSRIAAVLAADDRFSRPMAATVRSIVSQLSPGRGLDLYLCDMGITQQNREKIAAAAAHPEVRLHWVETLKQKVEHLPEVVPGVTRAAYARLFIPLVLPSGIDRALYLDSDLIVRRCVGEFFDLPTGDLAALGVADAGSPYVSSLYGVPTGPGTGGGPMM
jgi:lipopolysaccharide biosynthesis glycosyltransferase